MRPSGDGPVGAQGRGTCATVVLVGLPGTGKSTVAPLLATALDRRAVDLDSVVEQSAGASVPELFESVGEPGFRIRELEALRGTLGGEPVVLAAGGGLVTTSAARSQLERCTVAWLRARTDTLVDRLSAADDPGASRPLLAGDVPGALRERLAELSAARSPLYADVADLVVDVDDRSPTDVAQAILVELPRDRT